ncbi:MAG: copper resistance D family protein [Gemmatimonadales bacterium]
MAFQFLVLRHLGAGTPASRAELAAHVARGAAAACTVLVAVAPARLWFQARGLVESAGDALPMARGVLQTSWGTGWSIQCMLALVALAGFVVALRARRGGWGLAALAVGALVFTPAAMGHAIARERLTTLSVLCDGAHVAAAGAWVGALFFVWLASRAQRSRPEGGATLAPLIDAFHPVALTSAAVLVLSGTGNLLLRVDRLADLLGSSYGTVFFVKLGLTAVVLGLGARHSRSAAKRARTGAADAVSRSLATEAAFAALTIAVTALLTGTSPPMGA